MTKPSTSFMLTLLVIGCSDNPNEPPLETALPQGELAIAVNVTGDPSTGPDSFNIVLNGSKWISVPPNGVVRRSVDTGRHQVSLGPLATPTLGLPVDPVWCAKLAPDAESVAVEKGLLQTVSFGVDCPPLAGSGQLVVTVRVSSAKIPAVIPVTVSRLTRGPQYSQTIEVPANESLTVPSAVGVLQVAPASGSGCKGLYFSLIPLIAPGRPPRIALHNGDIGGVTLRVSCD